MDNPLKKADEAVKAWVAKEIRRGELRGEIRGLQLVEALIEQKIASAQAELDGGK